MRPELDDASAWVGPDLRARIAGLRGAVEIGGVSIDLRPRDGTVPNGWIAIGLRIKLKADGALIQYDHADELGRRVVGLPGNLRSAPAVLAPPGSKVGVADFKLADPDTSLAVPDQTKATALLWVEFPNGDVGHAPHRISYASSEMIEPTPGAELLRPSIEKLEQRLGHLERRVANGPPAAYLAKAVTEARHLFDLFAQQKTQLADACLEQPSDWGLILAASTNSQEFAAIFGFALARAEAEATLRPAVRKSIGHLRAGGTKRGEQRAANAREWKIQALKVAIELDRGQAAAAWSRTKLAIEILHHEHTALSLKMVSLKTLENWLRGEAESPNGPIRNRSRNLRTMKSSPGS